MRTIGFLILVITLGAVGWRYYSSTSEKPRPNSAPGVVLHTVTTKTMTQSLQAIGTTESLESIDVTSTITERVTALPMQEGQSVTQGTVLVELQKAEEQALLQGAQIELKEQLREYDRIEDLVRKKSIPSSELDSRQSLIDQARARIAEINARLAERQLVAPFDGVLGLRNLSVGALARPGDVITTLDAIDKLHINFDVPEKHLSLMTTGKTLTAHSAAYPKENFTGVIETLDSRVDPVSRSIRVRATLSNEGRKLRPGMLLTLDIINAQRPALLVPEQAVFMRGDQHFVYTIDQNNTASETAVKIGERQKGQVEIIDGLKTGQNIVLQGLLKVQPGIKVSPQIEEWRSNAA
ncbi:efflux RND transporter periplasmic adaptor subunit [Marinagarivorans cellulosilyticus]|uniref:Membrane fusion protein, multidrug efflux system n=1 Tax=Marinagarivorans cellulosilyticus TaxID=2721545 RepID=A0AAN2BIU9_9GAMM|nr:efflux RND transporter periplasmic adaptor subunit [Marinagarivorans cellulosilyticus]BCD96256.1 membrane fusion protein, multidrug efflux system [Marinagarivorans cellulosilyticus]